MFALIGIVVVFGSIVAGFLMEKGNLLVLLQPAELLIIGGAAVGTILAANPLPLTIRIFKSVLGIMAGSRFTQEFYLETLKLLHAIFAFARKKRHGEAGRGCGKPLEEPGVFQVSQGRQRPPCAAFCLRYAADGSGGSGGSARSGRAAGKRHRGPPSRDDGARPGSDGGGGRAARLGDRGRGAGGGDHDGSLGGPPEEIGRKVASALVGTFLGILLSYGLVSPVLRTSKKSMTRNCSITRHYAPV